MISYYLIKPLRNSQFLKEFDANFLPVVYLGVAVLCFAITKLFNFLADRVDKYKLVAGAYLAMMAVKIAFGIALASPGKVAVVGFYFFASAYFALALAAMWACINDIFLPEQAERCYGFIMVGSTLGAMMGSGFSKMLSESSWSDYPAQASALSMAIALVLLFLSSRQRRRQRADLGAATAAKAKPREVSTSSEFWADVRELLKRPYVRRIAIMVFVLAVFNTGVLDFSSNRAIDRGVGREQFEQTFTYLPADSFEAIHTLKQLNSDEARVELQRLAELSGQSPQTLSADYQKFRDGCEKRIRGVFSDIYFYQGVLGIVLVLVVARYLFRAVGVRYAAVAMPILAAISAVAFSFSLDILVVEVIAVVVGSMNYSFNNATKELLYSATDEETKFKFKPMIEGPFMRFGDAGASLLALALASLAALMGLPERAGQMTLLVLILFMVVLWGRAAFQAGRQYDEFRAKEAAESKPES